MISLRNLLEFERSFTNSKGRKKLVMIVTVDERSVENPYYTNTTKEVIILCPKILMLFLLNARGYFKSL